MRLAACVTVSALATAASVAATDAPLRLDPGNWRVRATSTTNGVADPDQDSEVCLRDERSDAKTAKETGIVVVAGEGDRLGPCKDR